MSSLIYGKVLLKNFQICKVQSNKEELRKMEKQMIRFMNIARQSPSYFIPILQKQIASFTNDRQIPLNQQIVYETNEGKKAWIQALNFLKQQKPIPGLEQHEGLNASSKDHANDLAKNNIFGHTGSDGSNFSERILRHCRKGHGSMAELIGADFHYQNRNHAEMTILGLIIDDGVSDRGHRKTIFNPNYKYVGCKSELQGQKVITVFNITQNKLVVRSQSGDGSSILENTGLSITNKYPKESQKSTMKSPRNQTDDRFCKTQLPKQFEKSMNLNKENDSRFASTLDNFKNVCPENFKQSGEDRFKQSVDKFKNSGQNNFRQTLTKGSNMTNSSQNRKLKQKKESSKIYYEDGSKITQVTTRLIYNDGTVEEKVEKSTVYLEQ